MLKPGDVVFVSAASGAVGSVVCQIAKLKGHTVVGSAGGPAKCAFVKHIGVDHVIDYKVTGDLTEALLHVAPTGIDVYFENVGGEHLEAALAAANPFARFAICGMISQYNATRLPDGPRNIMLERAHSLSQIVQGRELRKDAGETKMRRMDGRRQVFGGRIQMSGCATRT